MLMILNRPLWFRMLSRQHISSKGDQAHPYGVTLSNSFSKLSILDETLSQEKHKNVNIMDSFLVALALAVPGPNNNCYKHVAFEKNSLQVANM